MKKQLLIIAIILNASCALAMNNSSSRSNFPSLSEHIFSSISYFGKRLWQSYSKKIESELITNLRNNKDKLEIQLMRTSHGEIMRKTKSDQFFTSHLEPGQIENVAWLYHQEWWNEKTYNFLDENPTLLKIVQNTYINDYSALSAAIISKVPNNQKQKLIQELINRDFIPTPNDIELAELAFYDEMANYHEVLINLLHEDSASNSYILPKDIRKYLVQILIKLHKNDLWLLPNKNIKPNKYIKPMENINIWECLKRADQRADEQFEMLIFQIAQENHHRMGK